MCNSNDLISKVQLLRCAHNQWNAILVPGRGERLLQRYLLHPDTTCSFQLAAFSTALYSALKVSSKWEIHLRQGWWVSCATSSEVPLFEAKRRWRWSLQVSFITLNYQYTSWTWYLSGQLPSRGRKGWSPQYTFRVWRQVIISAIFYTVQVASLFNFLSPPCYLSHLFDDGR